MISSIYEKVEDGRYSLEAQLIVTDDGIMVFVSGGDKPHIGTVLMSQPRPSLKSSEEISCTTSIINRLSHKDDIIISPIAEVICRKTNAVVVASGGVHVDNAGESDINRLLGNMEALIKKLLQKL